MGWADLDETAQIALAAAYVRRRRFEAQIQAVEIGRLFVGPSQAAPARISSDAMLDRLGIN